MLNGLDLFSGIGGLSVALSEWVRPIAYCEIDPYCQGVLLSRQAAGYLEQAPIWDDIRILNGGIFEGAVDIIYGGFPCQDISVAGHGKGLEGERSGLFFEIVRLAKEIKPTFIFLENVPAITSRGGLRVVREITEMGYDCRWCVISAASVGALHRRERWFLLANSKHARWDDATRSGETPSMEQFPGWSEKPNGIEQLTRGDQRPDLSKENDVPNAMQSGRRANIRATHGNEAQNGSEHLLKPSGPCGDASNLPSLRRDEGTSQGVHTERETIVDAQFSDLRSPLFVDWENTEPLIRRDLDGISPWLDGNKMTRKSHKCIMAYVKHNGKSDERIQILQTLRDSVSEEVLREQTGRSGSLSAKEVLLAYLCKLQEEAKRSDNLSFESEEAEKGILRSVWFQEKFARSSHRSKHSKQYNRERPDSLSTLSFFLAQDSQEAWAAYRWENAKDDLANWNDGCFDGIACGIEHTIPNRVDKIRGLGNAVVPKQAKEAFKILMGLT